MEAGGAGAVNDGDEEVRGLYWVCCRFGWRERGWDGVASYWWRQGAWGRPTTGTRR